MKTTILIIALLITAFISNAQVPEPKKPSDWTQTTVDSTLSKLDLEDALKARNLDDGSDYIDSLTAVVNSRNIVVDDTLLITDIGKILYVSSDSLVNITVPLNASIAFPIGTTLIVWREGVNDVEIVIPTGGTLQSESGMTTIGAIETGIVLTKRAINTWKIMGRLK